MIREELRRMERLFDDADRLTAIDVSLTDVEVEAEGQAVRDARHGSSTDRR